MEKEEVRKRLNRPRTLLLVDLGLALLEKALERGPTVQNDDVMGSYVCYWCDEPDAAGHAPDCLWVEANKIYDIIMEEE